MKSFLQFITESDVNIADPKFNFLEDLQWEVATDWQMSAPNVWSKVYTAGDLELEFQYNKTSPYRRLHATVIDTAKENAVVVEHEYLHGSLEENVEQDLERVKEDLKHDFGKKFIFTLPVQALKEGRLERKINMLLEKTLLDQELEDQESGRDETGYHHGIDAQMTQAEIDLRQARDMQMGMYGDDNVETTCLHKNGKTYMSVDFTTICPKRREGSQCAYCYVEDARRLNCNAKKLYDYLPYRGEILKLSEKDINILNDMGGLRFFSTGDYMPAHDADIKQALDDASARNLRVKVITKQPKFVEKFANHPAINVINVSIDKLACGMPKEVAFDLRKRFPNVVRVRSVILNQDDFELDGIKDADLHTFNHSMSDKTKNTKGTGRYFDHNGFETWAPGIARGEKSIAHKAKQNPGKYCCGDHTIDPVTGEKIKGCRACNTKCGKNDIECQLANPRLDPKAEKVQLAKRELDAAKRKQEYDADRDGLTPEKAAANEEELATLQAKLDAAIAKLEKDQVKTLKKIPKKAPLKATRYGNIVANGPSDAKEDAA